MKRTKEITRKLFIEELESPASAETQGKVTTLAVGEEACKGGKGEVTTMAYGEEANGV